MLITFPSDEYQHYQYMANIFNINGQFNTQFKAQFAEQLKAQSNVNHLKISHHFLSETPFNFYHHHHYHLWYC